MGNMSSDTSSNSSGNDYQVKRIIAHKTINKRTYFLVKWRDFEEYSWVRESAMDCPIIKARYWKDDAVKKKKFEGANYILDEDETIDTDSEADPEESEIDSGEEDIIVIDKEEFDGIIEKEDIEEEDAEADKEVEMILFGKGKNGECCFGTGNIDNIITPAIEFDSELFDKLCQEYFIN